MPTRVAHVAIQVRRGARGGLAEPLEEYADSACIVYPLGAFVSLWTHPYASRESVTQFV